MNLPGEGESLLQVPLQLTSDQYFAFTPPALTLLTIGLLSYTYISNI